MCTPRRMHQGGSVASSHDRGRVEQLGLGASPSGAVLLAAWRLRLLAKLELWREEVETNCAEFFSRQQLRSVCRVIELSREIDGYPFIHDWLFCVFEALPMIAISISCFNYPSKYLGGGGGKRYISHGEMANVMETVTGSRLKSGERSRRPVF